MGSADRIFLTNTNYVAQTQRLMEHPLNNNFTEYSSLAIGSYEMIFTTTTFGVDRKYNIIIENKNTNVARGFEGSRDVYLSIKIRLYELILQNIPDPIDVLIPLVVLSLEEQILSQR